MLADPMIQTVMRADGVDAGALKATLFNAALALKTRTGARDRDARGSAALAAVAVAAGAREEPRLRGAA